MKMAISFIAGIMVCSLLLFGVNNVIPTRAETGDVSEQSEDSTQSIVDLVPDIERIYRESLTMPFQQAESKIYDEDIARFYRELLDNSVFYEPGSERN